MKRLAALALVGAAFAARAATTNEVDVAALVAAVDAGLSETNGWTLSGLGKYAASGRKPACVKFDTLKDWLLSPDYGAPIMRIDATNRCSSTVPTRWLHVLDVKGAAEGDLGHFPACSAGDSLELQSFDIGAGSSVSRVKLVLDGSGNTGNWGVGSLKVITADPVCEPTGLRVSRKGADWCGLSWVNGEGTVSNRVDTFLVGRGEGEAVLLDTGFDGFDAIDKKNPVPSADRLPGIDPALSGVNVYAPTNTSGICQVGTGDSLGFLRYDGIADYSNVVLRIRAKRYPRDNAETTIISVDSAGVTNEVTTIALGDDYADYEISLSSITNAGSALLLGYYKTKSNRRVLLDSLSIARVSADRETLVDSRWIPAAPGAASFSTKDHGIELLPKSEYRFGVHARNADGLVSGPMTVDTVLDSSPGFRFVLR